MTTVATDRGRSASVIFAIKPNADKAEKEKVPRSRAPTSERLTLAGK